MTTSVKVTVPDGANYVAEVVVKVGGHQHHVYTVNPGQVFETYAYAEREVIVREVPLNNPTKYDPDAPRGYRHIGMDHF